jgi:hypothetical protein
MVTRGTGKSKREEQDGWNGSIIPNQLIAQFLYSEELKALDDKRNKIQEAEMELAELVEAAKVEDSEEFEALFETIKKDKDDEPTDSFDKSTLSSELKGTDKKSEKYKLLKKVDNLLTTSATLTKELKNEEKELWDAVQERIEKLNQKQALEEEIRSKRESSRNIQEISLNESEEKTINPDVSKEFAEMLKNKLESHEDENTDLDKLRKERGEAETKLKEINDISAEGDEIYNPKISSLDPYREDF